MIKTNNPVLNAGTYEKWSAVAGAQAGVMTVKGTIHKSLILAGLLLTSFFVTFIKLSAGLESVKQVVPWLTGGALVTLGVALLTSFMPKAAPVTAPIYALLEGFLLGTISRIFEFKYPGIAFQAAGLTLGIFVSMLLLFTSRTIRATPGLKKFVYVATMGAFIFYLVSFALNMFGGVTIPYVHQTGPIGFLFSGVMIVIATLRLVVNFDLIEEGAAAQAPKFMEWYSGFALLVTLVWLYLEVLELLAKLRGRD
jgi:uncharacterized YccA/Bax inhibitor family protein